MSGQFTPAVSWSQRWRSLRNDWSLRIAAHIRFSRGVFVEAPCGRLGGQPAARAARIEQLAQNYDVRFETWLAEATSLNNYAYLDVLDRAFAAAGESPPRPAVLADVGSASFWYASVLQVFFRPGRLDGYDVEAWRRYASGHTRQDHANGHAQRWPQTRFHGVDYRQVSQAADLITCWYPFVSATPLLAWGLPLKLLTPKQLLSTIAANLKPDGAFFMVNQGAAEARVAAGIAESVGLRRQWLWDNTDPLLPRPQCPVASYWRH